MTSPKVLRVFSFFCFFLAFFSVSFFLFFDTGSLSCFPSHPSFILSPLLLTEWASLVNQQAAVILLSLLLRGCDHKCAPPCLAFYFASVSLTCHGRPSLAALCRVPDPFALCFCSPFSLAAFFLQGSHQMSACS